MRMRDRLTTKLVVPMTIVIGVLTLIAGLLTVRYIRTSMTANAEEQIYSKVAGISRSLDITNTIMLDEVRASAKVLKREGLAVGEPSLGNPTQVGSETVPNLLLGGIPQALNFQVVDRVKSIMGGNVTLFVKRGDDFIRVATNVPKEDGSRAVGTKLDPNGKAIVAVRQGKTFEGVVDILGVPHITSYEPMLDKEKHTIGIWYVGYPIASLSEVGKVIEDAQFLDSGFIALVDNRGNVIFKSKNVTKEAAETFLGPEGSYNSEDWKVVKRPFNPWGYTIVAGYSNNDKQLAGAISKVSWFVLLAGLLIAAILTGLCLWLSKTVTGQLGRAVEAANRLSRGDLSVDIAATSKDEAGQLLAAMKNMTAYLKEMADVSDRIAAGDLTVKPRPRSAEDRFGSSFKNMSEYLKEMAEVADSIAGGNLTVKVEPRSAEDRFGNSFKNMLDNTLSLVQSREERDLMQRAVMKLLDEVSDVANGDLTVEAEVTADMTGAIADAFNYMITELRRVITNVKDAALQVSSAANEINATTDHLATGSEAQSVQIVDTSSAIEEMVVSIQQVSENATLSAAVAEQALSNAKQGAQAVQNNIQGMNRIRDQVQETAKRIKRLGERSQEIGEIVQLINDIADRTSILALNASIQAAMAGEAGRGFAVVAEEVERLADRSTNATKQIAALVKTIQSETNEAVAAMEDTTHEVVEGSTLANVAGQSLTEIETVSNRLAEIIQSISLASKQQARGSEALAQSMNEISDVTHQVAAGTKQASVSVKNLVALADHLQSSVVTFKLPGGSGNGRDDGGVYANGNGKGVNLSVN